MGEQAKHTGLDPDRVEAILAKAVADGGEPLEVIVHTYRLNRATVAEHRAEVVAMLRELPDEFMDDGGGGWSFLNLCQDRRGRLWTGLQLTAEKLLALAMALDLADWLMPREIWDVLPGGVPYVRIKRRAFDKPAVAP